MNRRDVVVGLGGLVSMGTLASGTGAFSAAEVSRQASINVVNDNNGLVGLVANQAIGGVRMDSGGELTISLGNDDNPGINVNSVYQFGAFVSDKKVSDITDDTFSVVTDENPPDLSNGQDSLESAFAIVNQSPQNLSVTIEFDLNNHIDEGSGTTYAFELQTSRDGDGERQGVTTSPIDDDLETELHTGESIGVSFIVNALDGVTGDAITGSLAISAEST